jgi:DnaJ-class molecular chaperone
VRRAAVRCRRCRGSGTDPDLRQRYTTGGHNDRSCEACAGTGERGHDAARADAAEKERRGRAADKTRKRE